MEAAVKAARAGLDMEMGSGVFVKKLQEAVESGKM